MKEICEVIAQTQNKKVNDNMKRQCWMMEAIPDRKLHTELVFKVELVSCMNFIVVLKKYMLVLTFHLQSSLKTFNARYASIVQ